MKNSLMILPLLAIALLTACEKADYDLEKSVYVPDPEYSGLPAYSEWGYNTFGAFYERKIFIYNDNEVPAKVIHTKGITRFILKGGLVPADYNDYYYGNDYVNTTMSLSFELPGFAPGNYAHLVQLNDTAFDLSDPNLTVFAVLGNDTIQMDIFNGELSFEKARQLIVDDTPLKVILSGYFGFQALVNGEPVSMSYGRFDVGIDEYDFADY